MHQYFATRPGRLGTALAGILGLLVSTTEAENTMPQQPATDLYHTSYFKFGSTELDSFEQGRLKSIVGPLQSTDRRIMVRGFTDNIGSKKYNDQLARLRANEVAEYLQSQGVGQSQMEIGGTGLANYVADNSKEPTRRYNRRVEIRLYDRRLRSVPVDTDNRRSGYRDDLLLAGRYAAGAGRGDLLRTGRYSEQAPGPAPNQADPLEDLIEVTFPDSVSVGGALIHMLSRSGWSLAESRAADPTLDRLLSLDLPESQRHLGPMRLHEAVSVLCGKAYVVVADPVNRLISCELHRSYRETAWGQTPKSHLVVIEQAAAREE